MSKLHKQDQKCFEANVYRLNWQRQFSCKNRI